MEVMTTAQTAPQSRPALPCRGSEMVAYLETTIRRQTKEMKSSISENLMRDVSEEFRKWFPEGDEGEIGRAHALRDLDWSLLRRIVNSASAPGREGLTRTIAAMREISYWHYAVNKIGPEEAAEVVRKIAKESRSASNYLANRSKCVRSFINVLENFKDDESANLYKRNIENEKQLLNWLDDVIEFWTSSADDVATRFHPMYIKSFREFCAEYLGVEPTGDSGDLKTSEDKLQSFLSPNKFEEVIATATGWTREVNTANAWANPTSFVKSSAAPAHRPDLVSPSGVELETKVKGADIELAFTSPKWSAKTFSDLEVRLAFEIAQKKLDQNLEIKISTRKAPRHEVVVTIHKPRDMKPVLKLSSYLKDALEGY